MRVKFQEFYTPTKGEFDVLWKDSLIALDANVLLNLYTYSVETRDEVLRLLEDIQDRVWLPAQAAEEYHRRRIGIISKEADQYEAILKPLREVSRVLSSRKSHPFIASDLLKRFDKLINQIEASLKNGEATHSSLVRDDPIRDRLTDVFAGRVGDPFDRARLDQVFQEGKARFEQKTPPGYKDAAKPVPDRYGDLVMWKQLIEKASAAKTPVLLVTDDAKEDWWWIERKQTIGPRPELLREFGELTGQQLYIYTSDRFVEIAKEEGLSISQSVVDELEAARLDRKEEVRSAAGPKADAIAIANLRRRSRWSVRELEAYRGVPIGPFSEADLQEHFRAIDAALGRQGTAFRDAMSKAAEEANSAASSMFEDLARAAIELALVMGEKPEPSDPRDIPPDDEDPSG